LWRIAVPISGGTELNAAPSLEAKRLLTYLGAGLTGESVAREFGVSARAIARRSAGCRKSADAVPARRTGFVPGLVVGHYAGGVIEMSRANFEALVSDALDEVPEELALLIENVAVFVEDDPPPGDPELLGIYEGIPLTERGHEYGGVLPDRITIYRNPTLAICDTYSDVLDEVNITVVHEIAHHFGIDDARLHQLGYG
jgi:predicted Zn-dependent protease with MMP-like domain